jgi:hypothetical protein
MKSKTEIENNNIKQNCKQRTQHKNQKKLAGPVKYKWWKRFPVECWSRLKTAPAHKNTPAPKPRPRPVPPPVPEPAHTVPEPAPVPAHVPTPTRLKEIVNFSRLTSQLEGFSAASLIQLGLNPVDVQRFLDSWEVGS